MFFGTQSLYTALVVLELIKQTRAAWNLLIIFCASPAWSAGVKGVDCHTQLEKAVLWL